MGDLITEHDDDDPFTTGSILQPFGDDPGGRCARTATAAIIAAWLTWFGLTPLEIPTLAVGIAAATMSAEAGIGVNLRATVRTGNGFHRQRRHSAEPPI